MNNMNTNTYNFGQCGLEVGTIIRYIEWSGSEESRPRIQVASKTTATPLFGNKTKTIKLNEASREASFLETGERLTDYTSMDMWETETDGTLLRDFVTDKTEFNGFNKMSRKSKSSPWTDINYKTVYSNLLTASDVVRSDIPEAIGYDPKASALWNSYLDGGEGALASKSLSSELMDKGWSTDCCGWTTKIVAGFVICGKCGGEATFNLINGEGS